MKGTRNRAMDRVVARVHVKHGEKIVDLALCLPKRAVAAAGRRHITKPLAGKMLPAIKEAAKLVEAFTANEITALEFREQATVLVRAKANEMAKASPDINAHYVQIYFRGWINGTVRLSEEFKTGKITPNQFEKALNSSFNRIVDDLTSIMLVERRSRIHRQKHSMQ